jgi:2-dehydro-3-deoxyphosphogluconate aldolase / (4S)-4-hydroxy-2-oxoglutarate aldolase
MVTEFRKQPLMGILRDIEADHLDGLIRACISAGLKAIEITMNTPGACVLIKRACSLARKKIHVGAGTVLNVESLKSALDAGAEFIVSPCLVESVADMCVRKGIPLFPGAMSPSEVYNAYKKGAEMVKVFPAGRFGCEYIRDLKQPFNNIPILACGGVNDSNIKEYFSAGASAIAFGASVFSRDRLLKKDFRGIERSIKNLIKSKEA